jgi:hypothetical protein
MISPWLLIYIFAIFAVFVAGQPSLSAVPQAIAPNKGQRCNVG